MDDSPCDSARPFVRAAAEWHGNDLVRLQEWMTLTLQSSEIGLWEWEVATDRVHISSHWRELQGYTGPASTPHTKDDWLALVHVEDRPDCDRFVAALKESPGVVRQVDFRIRRADGSYAWQHCTGRLMQAGQGGTVIAVGIVVEVTAQREATLRQHTIERLETVGQLTGDLAHDFNNLLTVIQGNVDLLNDDLGGDPNTAPMLDEISLVVSRGSAVTRRLLTFARADTHESISAIDPNTLIRGVIPLLEHTLGGAVALHTDLATQGWAVRVDDREFENAILNLAINARDAMPGGGTLTLSSRSVRLRAADVHANRQEQPGAYVMVMIQDTGQGMSPAVMSRVFEPFFTTKADKGTGLGVPMVARFVRENGGFVRFESEVGSGTTVRLYLPRIPVR